MTYEEALKKKNEIGDTTIVKDIELSVFVSPKNRTDFLEFAASLMSEPLSDEKSKKYSSNNEFVVGGFKLYNSDVIHHVL